MTDPSESTVAWHRLLDRLRDAGEVVTGPLGATTPRERAEGYRHLVRLLSVAHEMWLEKADPAQPRFTRWMTPHRKLLGDSPETIYDTAPVSADRTYRLRGNRGDSHYLGIVVHGTSADGARRIISSIEDTDLEVGGDGTFEVVIQASEPATGSWLQLEDDATDIMVRQYFLRREDETEATYELEVATGGAVPPPLTEAELAARLDAMGDYVAEIVEVEATLSTLMGMATPGLLRAGSEYVDGEGEAAPPPIDPTVVAKALPSPAIQYTGSWFDDLGDDEMIAVTGTLPEARFFSIQVLSRWMESPDWTNHPCFLTTRHLDVDDDGRFRVVVSHQDPGARNWLSTTGLVNGNIAVRALHADGPMDVTFSREPLSADG